MNAPFNIVCIRWLGDTTHQTQVDVHATQVYKGKRTQLFTQTESTTPTNRIESRS